MTVNIIGKEESGKLTNTFLAWQTTKAKYTDAIILVKHENEYHTFGSDAEMLSALIGIETEKDADERITFRLPCFYTDWLLPKLVQRGYRIALCEALSYNPNQ